MSNPLVLFFAANPEPGPKTYLGLDREVRAIESALEHGPHGNRLRMHPRLAATEEDVVRALLAEPSARVVHFAMHGSGNGLRLSSEDGRELAWSTSAIERLLRTAPNIRLAVFNVCMGDQLASAVKGVVPCAIGARGQIPDSAARAFSAGLYLALAYGRTIDEAAEIGRARAEAASPGCGERFVIVAERAEARSERLLTSVPTRLPEPRPAPAEDPEAAQVVVLAGPSDEDATRSLCALLETPVFFAPLSVDYGEAVDELLPEAMRRARMFVVVSSGREDEDWYHRNNVQEAIHEVRVASREGRRVIPVYLYGDARTVEAAFGLRRIKGIFGAEVGGLPGIARALDGLFARMLTAASPRTPPPERVARARVAPDAATLVPWFAEHYPGRDEARGLWRRAGGNPAMVPDLTAPLDLWTALFARMESGAAVSVAHLVRAALVEYPHSRLLLSAL